MRGRIRSIKPEVHSDEDLWDLEVATGMPIFRAFTGLWNFADREGRFEWRVRQLKAAVLPYWDGDFSALLDALAAADFLIQYEVEGKVYGAVRTFLEHQSPNSKEVQSKIPPPPIPDSPRVPIQKKARDNPDAQASPPTSSPVPIQKVTSGNGTERNGTEGEARGRASSSAAAPQIRPEHCEPDLEPGEPEPETPWRTTLEMARELFDEHTGKGQIWDPPAMTKLKALAGKLDRLDGDPVRLYQRVLAQFVADDRARQQGFPIGYLTAGFGKYLAAARAADAGPTGPGGRPLSPLALEALRESQEQP